MTKKLFFLQFFLIILIFVLPPLFVKSDSGKEIFLGCFNFFALIDFFLAVFLFIQNRSVQKKKDIPLYLKIAGFYGITFFTFGLLLVSGVLFYLLAAAAGFKGGPVFCMPGIWYEYIFCFLNFFFMSFFEEALYRLYLPEALKKIFAAGAKDGAALEKDAGFSGRAAGAEIICVLLFSLSHSYAGLFAVLNAALAGIILRRSAVKAQSIMPGFISHLAYNLFSAAFILFL